MHYFKELKFCVFFFNSMINKISILNKNKILPYTCGASQVVLVVKNSPPNACYIPGSGRSLGGGHGYPLQYSCLKNPMDREAWRATVHRVGKSRT